MKGSSCKAKPWPKCDMAEYFMNKWDTYYEYLDTIPPISFCGSKEQWFAILEEEQKKLREKREKMKTEKKNSGKTEATSTKEQVKGQSISLKNGLNLSTNVLDIVHPTKFQR